MSKRSKQFFLLAAVLAALGSTTIARADGDGGDNSMNPITGDSRAKFDTDNPNLSTYAEQPYVGSYTYTQPAPQSPELSGSVRVTPAD